MKINTKWTESEFRMVRLFYEIKLTQLDFWRKQLKCTSAKSDIWVDKDGISISYGYGPGLDNPNFRNPEFEENRKKIEDYFKVGGYEVDVIDYKSYQRNKILEEILK